MEKSLLIFPSSTLLPVPFLTHSRSWWPLTCTPGLRQEDQQEAEDPGLGHPHSDRVTPEWKGHVTPLDPALLILHKVPVDSL